MSEIGDYYAESGNIELIRASGQARNYPRHMHARHWTLGVLRSGSALLTTATTTRELHGGRHFLIPPREIHSLRLEAESVLLVLCLDSAEALPAADSLLRILPSGERNLIQKALTACADRIAPLEAGEGTPAEGTLLSLSIRQVMRRLLENPGEDLDVEGMAAYAGYSPWHFLRAFRQVTGMTPHAFQLLCRLRLSRAMLRADAAGAAVAASAGFADQSHMHKVFKHHHGITPGEFRKASVKLGL